MHILIVELHMTGHRPATVRTLIEALLTLNTELPPTRQLKITLATTDVGLRTDGYREQIAPFADAITHERVVEPMTSKLPNANWRLANLAVAAGKARALLSLLRSGRFDHVYMPFADGTAQWLGLRRLLHCLRWPRKVVVEALLMNTPFASIDPDAGKPLTFRNRHQIRCLKVLPFDRVHITNALALPAMQRWAPELLSKVLLMPDPIPVLPTVGGNAARAAFGLTRENRVVGCVGGIDARKGVLQLVRAFLATDLGDEARLLLAGPHTPEVRNMLASVSDPRIVSIDRYLTDQEVQMATEAVDLMAVLYEQYFGPSSTIIRAAIAERMVLASDTGWTGRMVPEHRLGRVVEARDAAALQLTLAQALGEGHSFKASGMARAFARFYCSGNIAARWTDLLRTRLGMDRASGWVDWPDTQYAGK